MPRVVILGGGVGGLSAAHELAERGFEVEVYEKRAVAGGKARSYGVPGSAPPGRKPLPAEHGFRFFPGWYRHVTDTMKRIPAGQGKKTVFQQLRQVPRVQVTVNGRSPAVFPARYPRDASELALLLEGLLKFWTDSGLSKSEIDDYLGKIWKLLTSCEERRVGEYEPMSWWDFVDANGPGHTDLYRELLANSTRPLVAAKPDQASAKTVGDILLQMIFNLTAQRGPGADRILNGPTSDAWITPWVEYLETKRKVKFHFGAAVEGFNVQDGKISGVRFAGVPELVTGDYYVAALPVGAMARLVSPAMLFADPKLADLGDLAQDVEWMTGIMFYLGTDVKLQEAHQLCLGSPWSLTSISQPQFWPKVNLADEYGDGTVHGLISAIISEWERLGGNKKTAMDCTESEIADEVWRQLTTLLKDPELKGAVRLGHHLDEGISFASPPNPPTKTNAEPLLVNKANRRKLRPDAVTKIPNLFLASDYVLTSTDLATMEGANEAARRAVNGIIKADTGKRPKVMAPYCRIWELHEPPELAPLRRFDRERFKKGLEWDETIPLQFKLLYWALIHLGPVLRPVITAWSAVSRHFMMPR